MSAVTQRLLELQTVDSEIERLARQEERVRAQLGEQIKQRAAELALRQAEQALHVRESAQRDAEFELSRIEGRIKQQTEKLYSGKGSPRELQALQAELTLDKKRQGQLEEKALATMEATEAARKELDRIKTAVNRMLGELGAERERLTHEGEQLRAQLQRRQADRARLAGGLDAASLALYERLRGRIAGGVAVAALVQGHCDGCRTAVPSAEIQHARQAASPAQCSVCHRILHVPLG